MSDTCRRTSCRTAPTSEWAPWCSEECQLVGEAVERVPYAPVQAPDMSVAAVRFAFPWLDVRAQEVAS